MQQKLRNLNVNLRKKISAIPERSNLIKNIEDKVGEIKAAREFSDTEIQRLFGGRPLVGVDGSVYNYGSAFPYVISLFKSLAKSTSSGEDVEKSEIIVPLVDSHYEALKTYAGKYRIPPETAYAGFKEELLASLELDAAIEAVEKFDPAVILLDGGFLRFGKLVPEKLHRFREIALRNNCIAVGVIEEVGTFEMRKILKDDLPAACKNIYDRELLFGIFSPGEWLKVYDHHVLKKGYYTCFGRLALDPQACAWDFFEEQKKYAEDIINYLYTITPMQSRGIPLWIDVVDKEVRLTAAMVDLLIDSGLDPGLKELLFKPARQKRSY